MPAQTLAAAASFEDLGLRPELVSALTGLGYEEPTPIQREALPHPARGTRPARPGSDRDREDGGLRPSDPAEAGSAGGRRGRGEPLALVLVPTRELAVQVSEAVHRYGRGLGARVLPIYGGQPIGRQLRALRAGVDVVVANARPGPRPPGAGNVAPRGRRGVGAGRGR